MNLSAVIEVDRFFYGLFTDKNELVQVEEVVGNPELTIPATEILQKPFKHKSVIVCDNSMHLPSMIDGQEVSKYALSKNEEDVIIKEKLTGQDIETHYSIDKELYTYINTCFPKVIHLSSLLGEAMFPSNRNKVWSFFTEHRIHILYTNEKGLQFFSNYECRKKEDYLYFLMAVYQNKKLDPHEIPLHIGGRVGEESNIISLLKDYIRDVKFLSSTQFKSALGEEPHLYYDLHYLNACV